MGGAFSIAIRLFPAKLTLSLALSLYADGPCCNGRHLWAYNAHVCRPFQAALLRAVPLSERGPPHCRQDGTEGGILPPRGAAATCLPCSGLMGHLFPLQVSAVLQRCGVGGDLSVLVAEAMESRRSECQDAMLSALATLSRGSLEDFDWQAKVGSVPAAGGHPFTSVCLCAQVALASDSVGSVQEQLLMLQLTVLEGGGVLKHYQVELNRAELDSLIASLEGCSKVGVGGGGAAARWVWEGEGLQPCGCGRGRGCSQVGVGESSEMGCDNVSGLSCCLRR